MSSQYNDPYKNQYKANFADGQNNFIQTINQGPDILNPELFEGPMDRIMLGLKAHANTISHARLIALEETFPMTREALGDAKFNGLTRDYVEWENIKSRDNAQLGGRFSEFLEISKVAIKYCDLAAIEWAWLESYNAIDTDALTLEKLSEFDEDALLSQNVRWHPSVKLIKLHDCMPQPLEELKDIIDNPVAILLTRPDIEVKLLPIDSLTKKILEKSKNNTPMGNLLALASEIGDINNPLQPLLTIIGAGALICIGSED